jgi:hypothetical protein
MEQELYRSTRRVSLIVDSWIVDSWIMDSDSADRGQKSYGRTSSVTYIFAPSPAGSAFFPGMTEYVTVTLACRTHDPSIR